MSASIDITIYQGETFDRTFTYNTGTLASYTPVDLTGYTARMQIRERLEDSTTIAELTTENSKIVLGGVAGTIQLLLTDTETSAITTNGVYDLELISGGGVVTRLMQGKTILSKEVTR